jgi:hypothetical protein
MRFASICLVLLATAIIGSVIAEDKSVPDGTIYGHVYDAQTRQPVSGAWVYCLEANCPKQATDRDGYYSIENCFSPFTTYNIECIKNGYKSTRSVAETDSSGKATVDFSLEKNDETMPHSERITGAGSIRKQYHISNSANDYASVAIDIENADHYEYIYNINSDEMQSLADLKLVVKNADRITCSGNAKNRRDCPGDITTLIENGDLTYSNSVVASGQRVQASQNIMEANGDNINISGKAIGDNDTLIKNTITAYRSESFNGTQMISGGSETLTYNSVNALAGPLYVTSYIMEGGRALNAVTDVDAGNATISQRANLTDVSQSFNGVTGGSDFDTSIENSIGNGTRVYAKAGSGTLNHLSRASTIDASYAIEYEYMPVSYSTGTYDTAYASAGSEVSSDKRSANVLIADHCEHLKADHKTNLGRDALTQTSLNAIAGPLNVTSYIAAEGLTLNATANVAAGVADLNQSANLTEVYQSASGATGEATFHTAVTGAEGKTTWANTMLGSGTIIDLFHRALLEDASYRVGYEYMPVSYQTGTYDTAYASAGSEVRSNKKSANVLVADNCEHLQVAQETNLSKDAITYTSLNAIAGPLDVTSSVAAEGRTLNATANVVAGVEEINQSVNLTDAYQTSKGVAGGGTFFAAITNADRKTTRAYTTLGSGNVINLFQLASLKDAWYKVEYEYLPVSYQTGTYDTDLNTSRIEMY